MSRRWFVYAFLICVLRYYSLSQPEFALDDSTGRSLPRATGDSPIAIISDTQSPIFLETLRLPGHGNEEARTLLLQSILDIHPDAIVHLGDLVSLGFWERSWQEIDGFLGEAHRRGIHIYPTLGNHELILFPRSGLANFTDRFPWYGTTGYVARIGKVAVVLLNSNSPMLADEEQRAQQGWMEFTLEQLEADSSVRVVIVGCHHPPFTNNTIESPSDEVQRFFVPLFLRFEKCKLFLSGHSHAYEHFKHHGKDFMVLGGGGGLQHPLLIGAEQRWEDRFPLATEKRMFHYLECRATDAAQGFLGVGRCTPENVPDPERRPSGETSPANYRTIS